MKSATETIANVQIGRVRDGEAMEVSVHSLPWSVNPLPSAYAPS